MILFSTALALDCGSSPTPDACDLANRATAQINATAGANVVRDSHPRARLRPTALEQLFAGIEGATIDCSVDGTHGGTYQAGTWQGSWADLDGLDAGSAVGTFDPDAYTWEGTWTGGLSAGQEVAVFHSTGPLVGDRDGDLAAGRWIRRSGRRGVYAVRYGPCVQPPQVAIASWFPGDLSVTDADADGSPEGVDCDDADPTAFPGANEVCDGVDNDCDEQIDEGFADSFETFTEPFTSAPYDLNAEIVPDVVFGAGPCSFPDPFFGFPLNLAPGQTVVSSGLTGADPGDAFAFQTDFQSGVIDLGAFLLAAGQMSSSCYLGSVSYSAAEPVNVTVWVNGTPYSGTGTSGGILFQLSLFELFGSDYRVDVQPVGAPTSCPLDYTLDFVIP